MIYTWVLIIMISLGGRTGGGVSVTTQEFLSEENCWEAQKRVTQMQTALDGRTKVSATCIQK